MGTIRTKRQDTPLTTTCPLCDRSIQGAYACTYCADTAADDLRGIAYLAPHLGAKRARHKTTWVEPTIAVVREVKWRTDDNQNHTIPAAGHAPNGATASMPFDPRITAAGNTVANLLVTIVKEIWEEIDDSPIAGRLTIGALADHAARHTQKLRLLESAPDNFRRIQWARERLEHLLDSPPAQLYLGLCHEGECVEPLYTDMPAPGVGMATIVRCRKCSTQHETEQRRETLMAGVNDYHGTAKEVSRLLRLIGGNDVSVKMIWSYAKHGLIHSVGTRTEYDTMGRPREAAVYSIGAVREAAETTKAEREQKRKHHRDTRKAEVC